MSGNTADLNEIILRVELDGINDILLKFSDGSINYLGSIIKQYFTAILIHNLSNFDIYVSTTINADDTGLQGIKTIPANSSVKFYKDSIIQLSLFSKDNAIAEVLCYKDM